MKKPPDDFKKLRDILEQSRNILYILKQAPKLQMLNWYLGAGCIAQTVWNTLHGFSLENGINDFDLVYYDTSDISYEKEDELIHRGKELLGAVVATLDIKNEARAHLWYEKHFGYAIKPYTSVEDAISTWPTTATSIGVKYNDNNEFVVYAPYGIDDLLKMVIGPNKTQITEEIYLNKVKRWTTIWPKLTIIPWDEQERLHVVNRRPMLVV